MVSLFHAPCPSCGAEIEIHSATAVTEVCGHCHSMLILEGQALTESGRHSAVLRDFSPLQIGTSGSWKGQLFTLIGRLQVQYDGGGWNEWQMHKELPVQVGDPKDKDVEFTTVDKLPNDRATK